SRHCEPTGGSSTLAVDCADSPPAWHADSSSAAATTSHRLARISTTLFLAADQAVEQQQHDRSDHRADETCGLPGLVDAQLLAAIGGRQRTADAQQRGPEDAELVVAGLERPRHESGNETDEDGPED